MDGKIITVSIIGVGLSGGESYGRHLYRAKDKYKITDLCDIDETKLKKYGDAFEVERMACKQLLRTDDEVVDKVCRSLRLGHLGLHHQGTEWL